MVLGGINAVVHQVNPNVAFIVETTVAADVPTSSEDVWITKLGGGAALRAFDRSMITNPRLLSVAIEVAESSNIKYQVQVNPYGGTDAGVIHTYGAGVPSLVISTPARYIHSPASLINTDDLKQVEDLLKTLLLNIDVIRSRALISE